MTGALFGVLGLVLGSFANVLVYRVPLGLSIVRPPSSCPQCGARIRPYDNIPVVSWLLLRGRCRDCRAPFSVRYPLVEALTGAVFAGVGWRFGLSWTAAGEAALTFGLVVLGFIDLEHMILPRRLVYATLAAVSVTFLASCLVGDGRWSRLGVAVASGLVPCAIFFSINFLAPHALGFGDVRLAFLIGFGLGWLGAAYAFMGFLAASLIGSLVGVALIASGKAGRKTPVPFGIFLALGALLSLLLGAPVAHWWAHVALA